MALICFNLRYVFDESGIIKYLTNHESAKKNLIRQIEDLVKEVIRRIMIWWVFMSPKIQLKTNHIKNPGISVFS